MRVIGAGCGIAERAFAYGSMLGRIIFRRVESIAFALLLWKWFRIRRVPAWEPHATRNFSPSHRDKTRFVTHFPYFATVMTSQRDLFGGSITIAIPTTFVDVS